MIQVDSQDKVTVNENGLPPPGGWLNRNVFGMGLTSLLCDAGHEMATAVLAGFLTVIGAAGLLAGHHRRRGRCNVELRKTRGRLVERPPWPPQGNYHGRLRLDGRCIRAVCRGCKLAAGAGGADHRLVWPRHPWAVCGTPCWPSR